MFTNFQRKKLFDEKEKNDFGIMVTDMRVNLSFKNFIYNKKKLHKASHPLSKPFVCRAPFLIFDLISSTESLQLVK